jgi:hypothetical protein
LIRVFFWAFLFLAAGAVTVGLGLALVVAPGRTAAFLRAYFAVFPAPESRSARLAYRVFGALLALLGLMHGVEVGRSVLRLVLDRS